MINGWITNAAKSLELQVENLDASEVTEMFRRLRELYADPESELPMWETILHCTSRKRAEGWRDVSNFVADSECFLLTEKDGQDAFRFDNGSDLDRLLSECPGFEFYITDEGHNYLLCHNHHDYLIGAGASANWVAAKSNDASQMP